MNFGEISHGSSVRKKRNMLKAIYLLAAVSIGIAIGAIVVFQMLPGRHAASSTAPEIQPPVFEYYANLKIVIDGDKAKARKVSVTQTSAAISRFISSQESFSLRELKELPVIADMSEPMLKEIADFEVEFFHVDNERLQGDKDED